MTRPLLDQRHGTLGTLAVTALGLFSLAYWWPRFADFARFAFLCCFPVIFPFCYGMVRSGSFSHDPRKRRIVTVILAFHCVLLVGVALFWKAFPSKLSIRNQDFVFGFMAIEFAAMILLARLVRPKANSAHRQC